MDNFITDLETNIGTSLAQFQVARALHDWSHTAWYDSCEYINDNHSSKITKGSITSLGVLSSGDDAYWGLDHLNTSLRDLVKTDTSLFAYYGYIPNETSSNKFFVVTNGNIYRFETSQANQYFNAAKSSLINYTASRYYGSIGDSTNETASVNAGISNQSTFIGNIN